MRSIFRVVTRLTPSGLFIFNENPIDRPSSTTEVEPTTGMERLRRMYNSREEAISPELNMAIQSSLSGVFMGVCIGGFVRSRNAYMYFIENNQATVFKTTFEAKKKLQDYVTVAFCKGALEWGWRLGAFMGIFSLTSTTISVYRGKTSLLEYVVAGTVTGCLYKVNLGLAAALVGAGLGAVLSTMGGLLILGILKLGGVTMDDIQKALFQLKLVREYHYNQIIERTSKNKNDDLTRHHDEMVEQKGEQTVEEIQ